MIADAQGGALSELTDANGAGGSFKDRGYALCTDVNFAPVHFWVEYPIHRVDAENLSTAYAEGSTESNLSKSGKRTTAEERKQNLDNAFEVCSENGHAKARDMAEYLGMSKKSISRYIKEYEEEYYCENGIVFRKDDE